MSWVAAGTAAAGLLMSNADKKKKKKGKKKEMEEEKAMRFARGKRFTGTKLVSNTGVIGAAEGSTVAQRRMLRKRIKESN